MPSRARAAGARVLGGAAGVSPDDGGPPLPSPLPHRPPHRGRWTTRGSFPLASPSDAKEQVEMMGIEERQGFASISVWKVEKKTTKKIKRDGRNL